MLELAVCMSVPLFQPTEGSERVETESHFPLYWAEQILQTVCYIDKGPMLHLLLHPPISCVCSLSGFGGQSQLASIIPGGFVGYHILIFNKQEKLCDRDGCIKTKRCITKVCVCGGGVILRLSFSVHLRLHLLVCTRVTSYTHNIHLGSPVIYYSYLSSLNLVGSIWLQISISTNNLRVFPRLVCVFHEHRDFWIVHCTWSQLRPL